MVGREKYLSDRDFEKFFDLKKIQFSISKENYFDRFHGNVIEAAKKDRKKWMLINEIRNNKAQNFKFENCFWWLCIANKKIAGLINYRFSTVGKFQGPQFPQQMSNGSNSKPKNSRFEFATVKDCHDAIWF